MGNSNYTSNINNNKNNNNIDGIVYSSAPLNPNMNNILTI